MRYEVLRTDQADAQIRDLIYYIADDSGSVEIALAYLEKLEHAIRLLEDQPYNGAEPRYPFLRRMKFRVLIVERHLIFYKVRERDHTVIVYTVVDLRRDYLELIR